MSAFTTQQTNFSGRTRRPWFHFARPVWRAGTSQLLAPDPAGGYRLKCTLIFGVAALMLIPAGCKSHSPSQYISPRVVGRVLDSQTQLPIRNVQVRRVTADEEARRAESEKGAQRMKQPLIVLTGEDGRFVLGSVREFAVFRQIGWYSVNLSFDHAGYERRVAPFTAAHATNSIAGEPVVNTGDVLLVPRAK